jgi:hypothetical protein
MSRVVSENLSRVSGKWFDRILRKDGSVEFGQHGEFKWDSNQIQNTFMSLLAGFCIQEATFSAGINVLGVGHGDVAWDSTPPTLSHSDTTLLDEFFRKELTEGTDSYFINPGTNAPSVTPTNKIEMTVLLDYAEANGALREFGLFGGDALPGTLDSGQMVNWVRHARIDKDSSMAIERKIRILFETL